MATKKTPTFEVGDYAVFHPRLFKKYNRMALSRYAPTKKTILRISSINPTYIDTWTIDGRRVEILTHHINCLSAISKKKQKAIKDAQLEVRVLLIQMKQPFFLENKDKLPSWGNMTQLIKDKQDNLNALLVL